MSAEFLTETYNDLVLLPIQSFLSKVLSTVYYSYWKMTEDFEHKKKFLYWVTPLLWEEDTSQHLLICVRKNKIIMGTENWTSGRIVAWASRANLILHSILGYLKRYNFSSRFPPSPLSLCFSRTLIIHSTYFSSVWSLRKTVNPLKLFFKRIWNKFVRKIQIWTSTVEVIHFSIVKPCNF